MEESVNRDENGRDNKGRFTEGNKGGGRPAVAQEFRLRCREFMEADGGGWAALIAMAGDIKERERLRALELIAAYAYGKPKQGVELTGEDGGPIALSHLTTSELLDRVREAVSKLEG